MRTFVRPLIAKVGWRLPLSRALSSRQPIVLCYHGVPSLALAGGVDAPAFERQVIFLKTHFEVVAPDALLAPPRRFSSRIQVLLTFDDGFRNNFEVVRPILRRHNVPAIFFVCTRHSSAGQYLWFTYLRALQAWFKHRSFFFRSQSFDMSPVQRQATVAKLWSLLLQLRPHPQAMYEAIEHELPTLEDFVPSAALIHHCCGMTPDQIEELAGDELFRVGIHTVDHPLLSQCDSAEMARQIADNKRWIEQLTKKVCNLVAYPGADYTPQVLNECRRLDLRCGFSMGRTIEGDASLQLRRVGIYRASLDELGFKVRWGHMLQRIQNHGYLVSN